MSGDPITDWPRVGLLPVVHAIEAALREKRGFSLIRLGDGEGVLLDHANVAQADGLAASIACWFGEQQLSSLEIAQLSTMLRDAIVGADVIGLPRPRQQAMNSRFSAVIPHVAAVRGARSGGLFCDMAMHFYLQWSGALARLLRSVDRLSIITCRDIAQRLAACYGVEVNSILVRGEACWPGATREQHWPDGYHRVMGMIAALVPGELVLVGAGTLGKAYCEAIRQRGAVAVDIGSGFDGWAGVMSRPGRIDATPEFAIEWACNERLDDDALMSRLAPIVAQTNIVDGVQ